MWKFMLVGVTALCFTACGSDSEKTADSGTGGTGETGGFTLSGVVVYFATLTPVAEGLCVVVADPTPVLTGGELGIVGQGLTGAGGTFEIADLIVDSAIGVLVVAQDCAAEGTVFPTASGIAVEDYADLGAGDSIEGFTGLSIDVATQAGYQAGLGAAGYAGDLGTDGVVIAVVVNQADEPIEGATIVPPATSPTDVYYFTGVDFSGAATSAAAGARVMMPGAPIGGYGAEADGYTFEGELTGAQPGYALLAKFDSFE